MSFVDINHWHARLVGGEIRAARVLPADGPGQYVVTAEETPSPLPRAMFPGAFNPLHRAHRRMGDLAEDMLGRQIEFEISLENVDKSRLDIAAAARRLEQFPPHQPVWLTRTARFAEKAACFPGATFVVGADTICRIADPDYYQQDVRARDAAIAHLAAHACRFLVFGRLLKTDFCTLSNIELPPALLELCREVPESRFREDLSSTQLRIADGR